MDNYSENQSYKPEGKELLNELYRVQDYLEESTNKMTEFWNLERKFRNNILHLEKIRHIEHIQTQTVSGKFQYLLFVMGIAFGIITVIISLFSGNFSSAIFCTSVVGAFAYGKSKENKKIFKISGFIIILLAITFVSGQIDTFKYYREIGNNETLIFSYVVYTIAIIIAIIVSSILLKRYNRYVKSKNLDIDEQNRNIDEQNRNIDLKNEQIAQYNIEIKNRRSDLSREITEINKTMVLETESWFPPDYYSLNDVEKFISYVKNHRADTVKEMINIHIESGFRDSLLDSQKQINDKLEQSLNNQRQMIQLQSVSNVLLMGNMIANLATYRNTSMIRDNTSRIQENTNKTAEELAKRAQRGYK